MVVATRHGVGRSGQPESRKMKHHVEQYPARDECVTLHTWMSVEGSKKENFYITGVPGAPIPLWFRDILRKKDLCDITDFPFCSSCL